MPYRLAESRTGDGRGEGEDAEDEECGDGADARYCGYCDGVTVDESDNTEVVTEGWRSWIEVEPGGWRVFRVPVLRALPLPLSLPPLRVDRLSVLCPLRREDWADTLGRSSVPNRDELPALSVAPSPCPLCALFLRSRHQNISHASLSGYEGLSE